MINVAIVDDEEKERETIKECLNFCAEKEAVKLQMFEFSSGLALLGNYKPIYDIILLDIDMPGTNGLEIAHMLREIDKFVVIIFITNMAKFAVRGYEVDALDFIVKPINKFSFAMKMARAIGRTGKRVEESIYIKTDGAIVCTQIASIKYLEVNEHYVTYHTTEGDFSECITLKKAEGKLQKDFFVRCNRCYLINLHYVTSVKGLSVFLGNEELSISRPQKTAFLTAYLKFIAGGDK